MSEDKKAHFLELSGEVDTTDFSVDSIDISAGRRLYDENGKQIGSIKATYGIDKKVELKAEIEF